ncbi:MAG TPA: HD domain-containing phosphohydrolase [Vicinamibacterales bacterium]|nr:HD domain-containing phosphohydrolase [Vicinamibacterales bacterium]
MTARHSSGKVLVADDETTNVALLTRMMRHLGHEVVSAANGQSALDAVENDRPDLVLLDVNMPRIDGVEVCRSIKSNPATRLVPVILVTGLSAVHDRVRGIDAGADDFLSKPFVAVELEARVRSLMRRKQLTDGLDSAEAIMMSLALTIEARDPYTRGHCERLADLASALGARIGLDPAQCEALYRGGFLHDVGKIGIPDAILLKSSRLTAAEFAVMQHHTVIGDTLCRQLHSLDAVRPIVRHHHERADGTGYPDGLAGAEIPLVAEIVGVVDAYDAMTTDRPYSAALLAEDAFEQLWEDVKRGWKRAELVDSFVGMMTPRINKRTCQ